MCWARYVLVDQAIRGGGGMRSTECPSRFLICFCFNSSRTLCGRFHSMRLLVNGTYPGTKCSSTSPCPAVGPSRPSGRCTRSGQDKLGGRNSSQSRPHTHSHQSLRTYGVNFQLDYKRIMSKQSPAAKFISYAREGLIYNVHS